MHVFSVVQEAEFNPKKHVEKILGTDRSRAMSRWPAGSRARSARIIAIPHATEIYFCFEGGGTMRTPDETIDGRARRFCRASARRSARIRQRAAPHAAVSRPLRHRHGGAPSSTGAAGPAGRKARRTPTITGVHPAASGALDRAAVTRYCDCARPDSRSARHAKRVVRLAEIGIAALRRQALRHDE